MLPWRRDTFSSELGILSKSKPRLITTGQTVPPGTNGGVTVEGILTGAAGAGLIGIVSAVMLPVCGSLGGLDGMRFLGLKYTTGDKLYFALLITVWGTLGSLLDSLLGAVLQASVVDRRSGKIVEGEGGRKVLYSRTIRDAGGKVVESPTIKKSGSLRRRKSMDGLHKKSEEQGPSRSVLSGKDILDNNQINFLMAAIMTLGGMFMASLIWHEPFISSILP